MPRLVLASLHAAPGPEALPLGAASVAAALKADPELGPRLELRLVEGLAAEAPAGLAARILEGGPDWLGFSVYSWNRPAFGRLAALLRARRPGLILFAGGPEASADPGGVLSELGLDFLVLGEGEGTAPSALRLLAAALRAGPGKGASGSGPAAPASAPGPAAGSDTGPAAPGLAPELREALAALPGIALPGRLGELRRAPALEPGLLPSPWLSGVLSPRGREGILWELSRGCPFRCSYCYEGRGERGRRALPRERIEAELELFAASGAGQVFVLDPTFNADREAAARLLALFRERAPGLRWKFEVRAELLDRGLARAFAALDCSLQVGLQSARPEVLALAGRPGFEPARFARSLRLLDEAGARFGLDLIYGLPGDDLGGFEASLDYALERAPNHLDLFRLAVLPGTELAERAGELGLEVQPGAPHLLLSSPSFPREDLARAEGLARAAELFYSRGRAVPWFLAALRPLRARPSALLQRFAGFLGAGRAGEEAGQGEIEELQLAFLEGEYRAAGLGALLPALRDLLRLNGAWARALAEGEATELSLSYGPEGILGGAALDLAAFARLARAAPRRWRVSPGPGGPRIEAAAPGGPRGSSGGDRPPGSPRGAGAGARSPGPRPRRRPGPPSSRR